MSLVYNIHKRAIDAILKDMAKFEIVKRSVNPIKTLWWHYWPGTKITVNWPSGEVIIDDSMDEYDWTMGAKRYSFQSNDPNDHYRPWLEKNVGKQGWDWDWRIENDNVTSNTLTIKFRKPNAKWATIAALKWT